MLLVKILTEAGMEHSLKEDHRKALQYFNRAVKILPDDRTVLDLIELSESAVTREKKTRRNTRRETEELKKMSSIIEKYQEEQDKLLKQYSGMQAKVREVTESSEKEREKLQVLLSKKESALIKMLDKQAAEKKKFKKRIMAVSGGSAVLIAVIVMFLLRKQHKIKQSGRKVQKKLQDDLKASEDAKKELSEYDKKMKKIEIIESSLGGDDPYENQVALNMLEDFSSDKDFRIRLRVVGVLHKIDPDVAVEIIRKVIGQENDEYRNAACKLMEKLHSPACVDLLLELSDSRDNNMRKLVLDALNRLIQNPDTGTALKEKIKDRLSREYAEDDWIK
jgi:tetratricopeptide (TPR) repeat protein